MDIYAETTIHRQITSNPDKIKQIFLVAFLVPVLLGIFVHMLFFILAAITGLMYLWTRRNVEMDLDYILVNDELEIARILRQKSRTRMALVNLRNVILIAPKDAEELAPFEKVLPKDFSEGDPSKPPYIMVCQINGEPRRFAMQFPEDMLEMIRRQIPDRVIK